jgi:calcineurin-like phosphoesterase family protein
MSLRFIHLSDIHFGQEHGERLHIHTDVRDQVLADVEVLRETFPDNKIDGVLVTGDLAFSGTPEEYGSAGEFLDNLTERAGCPRTAVRVIPGNHDIHRESICEASNWMLSELKDKGAEALDRFLQKEQDRDVLYSRLRHYGNFANAYDCPLDGFGGIAGQAVFSISPDRNLRFLGLNSALACGKDDEQGKLILGAKQWVLPRNKGEELIVLCHHPLHWFRDSEDALRYVRTRARVFISGHEHSPSFDVVRIEGGCDLLVLAAGATTPPKESEIYKYTYNIIEFDWEPKQDGLLVKLYPRVWSNHDTRFVEHFDLPGKERNPVVLGSPNFRAAGLKTVNYAAEEPFVDSGVHFDNTIKAEGTQMGDDFPLQLLRFFRDLTGAQRISVLIKLGALPQNWIEPLNHSAERRALERIRTEKRVGELKSAVDEQLENEMRKQE